MRGESGDDAWKLRKISDAEDKLYPLMFLSVLRSILHSCGYFHI